MCDMGPGRMGSKDDVPLVDARFERLLRKTKAGGNAFRSPMVLADTSTHSATNPPTTWYRGDDGE